MITKYAKMLYGFLSQLTTTYSQRITSQINTPNEYITYECNCGNFATPFIQPISIYSKSENYERILQLMDALESRIGEGGVYIKSDNLTIRIMKGSPFYQSMEDEEENWKFGYVNLEITIYQKE